jgi:hypothetical protein
LIGTSNREGATSQVTMSTSSALVTAISSSASSTPACSSTSGCEAKPVIAWMSRLSPIFWVSSARWPILVTSLPAIAR